MPLRRSGLPWHGRGDNWQLPELWAKYAGYFSPYLQRRIDRLAQEQGWSSCRWASALGWSITPREVVEVPREPALIFR